MRFVRLLAMVGLILGVGALGPVGIARAADEALCVVCAVREGATEAEAVHAWRTYDGQRLGFCSEKCALAFDADPAAYVPASLPRPAPELGFSDLGGHPLTWKALEGKVVLVDFWATWCAPCRKSMPELQALHAKYAARGFQVLGVSIDEHKDAAKVKKYVKSKGFTYPIALDAAESPAWERFRVKTVPAAFLVDRDGRIVSQWLGKAADMREVEARLPALLGSPD